VLENATILPFEGQRDIHRMFVQCQLGMALQAMKAGRFTEALKWLEGSREFPERLGSGKPHNPDYRVQDYLSMLCYEGLGELDKAEAAKARIYDYASFYPKKNADVVRRKVDLWKESIEGMPELDALETLHDLVVGERRRR
jgi:hypothetical protein